MNLSTLGKDAYLQKFLQCKYRNF